MLLIEHESRFITRGTRLSSILLQQSSEPFLFYQSFEFTLVQAQIYFNLQIDGYLRAAADGKGDLLLIENFVERRYWNTWKVNSFSSW